MKQLIKAILVLSMAFIGMSQAHATEERKAQDQEMASDVETKGQPINSAHRNTVPSDAVLRQRLTPLQYRVTREDATEPAYNNPYWDNHQLGIYLDIISGVPLFSSIDKYDSGTGWPSFTRPLDRETIVMGVEHGFFSVYSEVRSKLSDAHLGHVFDDGPPPTGLRYCINSAALRFIPVADLEKEGYGQFLQLFK